MEDIVEDLRATADDTDAVENASVARLLEKAAGEIARLRLTDAEREAVEAAMFGDVDATVIATLRNLLARLSY
jgi:hypothetical protein